MLWMAAAFAAGLGGLSRLDVVPSRWLLLFVALYAFAIVAFLLSRRRSRQARFGQGGTGLPASSANRLAGRLSAGPDRIGASWLRAAWIAGLLATSCFAAWQLQISRRALPPNHLQRLIESSAIDWQEPVRLSGWLTSEPRRRPGGTVYEIEAEAIEWGGQPAAAGPASGGVRLSYYERPEEPATQAVLLPDVHLPDVHPGDRIEVLAKFHPPRLFRNPGGFDYRAHLARQGVFLLGNLRDPALLERKGQGAAGVRSQLSRLRARLLEKLDRFYPEKSDADVVAVLKAMLLGDRDFVEEEIAEDFRRTGTFHALVLSGLQVGALAAFLWLALRRLRVSPVWTTAVILLALILYALLVEDRPPIARAVWFTGVYLVGRLLYRNLDFLNSVSVAALGLLWLRPEWLFDAGFQLSFLAVYSIGAIGLPWVEATTTPRRQALFDLEDVRRDDRLEPRQAQWRIELRMLVGWLEGKIARLLGRPAAGLRSRAIARAAVTWPVRFGLRLADLILISAAIQIGFLVAGAVYFHRVSWSGLGANVVVVPLVGIIVPLGFLTLAAGAGWSLLGLWLGKALGLVTHGMLAAVSWFSAASILSHRVPMPPRWLTIAYLATFVLFALSLRAPRWPRRWRPAAAAPLLLAIYLVAACPFPPALYPGKLEMTVLDVGQGDSILVAFPDGRTMLIDGGGQIGAFLEAGRRRGMDIGEEVVSPYLWWRRIKKLDWVVLTHAHHDHLDGLRAIAENFRIGTVWVSHHPDSQAYRRLLDVFARNKIPVVELRAGEHFAVGSVEGKILSPSAEHSPPRPPANNDSLVVLLRFGPASGGVRLLLPGDIERKVEHGLVDDGAPLASDILKVPHHGSRSSSSAEFLSAVSARYRVMSVGAGNPFGHPHAETIERLKRNGGALFRTDRDGAVTFLTDGRTIQATTYAAASK